MSHSTFREGDEFYCPKCAKRWGLNETPPTCESRQRKEYLKFVAKKNLLAPKVR